MNGEHLPEAWAEFDGGTPIERQPIATAPRDGTMIIVGDPDVGEFPMSWSHIQRNGLFPGRVGMWVISGGGMTWTEHDGAGPTTWRPAASVGTRPEGGDALAAPFTSDAVPLAADAQTPAEDQLND